VGCFVYATWVSVGGHTRRRSKSTQPVEPTKLAELTKESAALGRRESAVTGPFPIAQTEASADPAAEIAVPRAITVEDPITTQVLAEVAREQPDGVLLDDAGIDDAVDKLCAAVTNHPHTRRRRR
jgi:hypothetical protein